MPPRLPLIALDKPMSTPAHRCLILASSSPYRRTLLERLGLPFTVYAPDIDESALPQEAAPQLVQRLAQAKARKVAETAPDALIIASDQVAVLDGEIIGKPGNHAHAVAQLQRAAGRTLIFYNGLCLLDSASGQCQLALEEFQVQFRTLSAAMIEAYLRREQPYHCAGSCKSEGLGIVLFERLRGDDPNSLIGLPLIRLTRMLEAAGVDVLA